MAREIKDFTEEEKKDLSRLVTNATKVGCLLIGVTFAGAGIYTLKIVDNIPVLYEAQSLKQASEILSTYSGNSPGTAVSEALALVEKSDAANTRYTQEFSALEQSLNTVLDGGINGLTEPRVYQPILKDLASETGRLAGADVGKGLFAVSGYGLLACGTTCAGMIIGDVVYSLFKKKREEN
jgi:hypothetical protein